MEVKKNIIRVSAYLGVSKKNFFNGKASFTDLILIDRLNENIKKIQKQDIFKYADDIIFSLRPSLRDMLYSKARNYNDKVIKLILLNNVDKVNPEIIDLYNKTKNVRTQIPGIQLPEYNYEERCHSVRCHCYWCYMDIWIKNGGPNRIEDRERSYYAALNWYNQIKNQLSPGYGKSSDIIFKGIPSLDDKYFNEHPTDSLVNLAKEMKKVDLGTINITNFDLKDRNRVIQLGATDKLPGQLVGMGPLEEKSFNKIRRNYLSQIEQQRKYKFVESQIFSKVKGEMKDTLKSVQEAGYSVKNTCSGIDRTMDFFSSEDGLSLLISQSIKRFLPVFKDKAIEKVDLIRRQLTILFMVLYNLIRRFYGKIETVDVVINVISYLSLLDISSELIKKITKKIKKIYNDNRIFTQSKDIFSADNVMISFKVLVLGFFLVTARALPGKHNVDEYIRRLDTIPKALTGVERLWALAERLFSKGTAFVEEHILKRDLSIRDTKVLKEVKNWVEEVAKYTSLHERKQLQKDPATCTKVGDLHSRGISLIKELGSGLYPRENIEMVKSCLQTTKLLLDDCMQSGALTAVMRPEPLVVWFTGNTGVGKSSMVYPFILDMMSVKGEIPEDWEQQVYARQAECEYWDGYHGQKFVVYDDAFQTRDSVSNPNPELMELIRLGNNFPCQLHMAAISEKGTYAEPEVVFLSSNNPSIEAESIYSKEAVGRRIHFCFKVDINEEYRLYYNDKNGKRQHRVDPKKITAGAIDMKVYTFHQWDPVANKSLGKIYDYYELRQDLKRAYAQKLEKHLDYRGFLSKYRVTLNEIEKQKGKQGLVEREDWHNIELDHMFFEQLYKSEGIKTQAGDQFKLDDFYPDREEEGIDWMKDMALILQGVCRCCEQRCELCRKRQILKVMNYYVVVKRPMSMTYLTKEVPKHALREMLDKYFEPPVRTSDEWTVRVKENWAELFVKYEGGKINIMSKIQSFVKDKFNALIDTCDQALSKVLDCSAWQVFKNILGFIALSLSMLSIFQVGRHIYKRIKNGRKYNFEKDCYDINKIAQQGYECMFEIGCENCDYCIENNNKRNKWGLQCACAVRHFEENQATLDQFTARWMCNQAQEDFKKDNVIIDSQVNEDPTVNHKNNIKIVHQIDEDPSVKHKNNIKIVHQVDEDPTVNHKNGYRCVYQNQIHKDKLGKVVLSQNSGDSEFLKRSNERFMRFDLTAVKDPELKTQFQSLLNNGKQDLLSTYVQASAFYRDTNAEDIAQTVVWNNTYRLFIVDKQGVAIKDCGNVFFISGRIGLMPYHYHIFLEHYKDCEFALATLAGVTEVLCPISFLLDEKNYYQYPNKDLMMVRFPLQISLKKKIDHLFISKKQYSKLEGCPGQLCRYSTYNGKIVRTASVFSAVLISDKPLSATNICDGKELVVVTREAYEYNIPTIGGDCGSALIIYNKSVKGCIAGIHVAGDVGRGIGYSAPVSSEELEEGFSKFSVLDKYTQSGINLQCLELTDRPSINAIQNGTNFAIEEVLPIKLHRPVKSKVVPAPCQNEIFETEVMPCRLRPFKNVDGEIVDPMDLGRKKWGKNVTPIPDDEAKIVYEGIRDKYFHITNIEPPYTRYPLTLEESILGIDGDPHLKAINKKSSPGFPYVLDKTNPSGKKWIFGDFEFDLTTPQALKVIEDVKFLEKQMLNGERPRVYWIDTLKDEKKPKEKVLMGKTRLFAAGPMHYTILARRYILPFLCHMMYQRIHNTCAVGINPISPEWQSLYNHLSKCGTETVIAGDYSNWDGTTPIIAQKYFFELIVEWYEMHWDLVVKYGRNVALCGEIMDQQTFSDLIRKIGVESYIHNHITTIGDESVVYTVRNGMPSGCPTTAYQNSFVNEFVSYYAWRKVFEDDKSMQSSKQFHSLTSRIYYGDDVLISVHPFVADKFNLISMANVLDDISMTLTDEAKQGVAISTKPLSEASFLKRRFRFDKQIHQMVAPLSIKTILEMSNWMHNSDEDRYKILRDNFEIMNKELCLHDAETHLKWMGCIRKVALKHLYQKPFSCNFVNRTDFLMQVKTGQYEFHF